MARRSEMTLQAPTTTPGTRRLDWATLMKRTWGFEVLVCPRCTGSMEIVAMIEDERVAHRILEHLALPSRAPPRGRPWQPGQQQLFAADGHADRFDAVDPPVATD